MILRSGELWGGPARWGGPPRVKAYRGGLRDDDVGFEFFTFVEPNFADNPAPQWGARADGSVWDEDGTARLRVLVTKVSQNIA